MDPIPTRGLLFGNHERVNAVLEMLTGPIRILMPTSQTPSVSTAGLSNPLYPAAQRDGP